ncbi:MAG: molybdopterin-guanine dinucleotide biosynthesis protein B [Actinomycetota bacterium]|nr:molybdopterin-guanine dinucleotide biosynthesis protein B [Actinomycetota bacterium]
MIPVVSVVGKSNAGKTTFLVKLIEELKGRGYRVAIIKHNVHDFEMDHPGKDTHRHFEAGADTVVIASAHKMAMVKRLDGELAVDEIIALVGPGYDLVLTEGYKRGRFPKIEVSRKDHGSELISEADELIAVVTDNEFAVERPQFALDDAAGVADLIEKSYLAGADRPGEIEGSPSGALR